MGITEGWTILMKHCLLARIVAAFRNKDLTLVTLWQAAGAAQADLRARIRGNLLLYYTVFTDFPAFAIAFLAPC